MRFKSPGRGVLPSPVTNYAAALRAAQDMQTEDGIFGWLGSALGSVIRFIIDILRGFFGGFGEAVRDFLHGLAGSVGMSPSFFNYVWLFVGLALLVAAVRALIGRAILAAIVWAVLAVLVLGSLVG